ncbi:MAG: hypothetical protein U0610_22435 [bacterium]
MLVAASALGGVGARPDRGRRGATDDEWCDADTLRAFKRRALALRREIEPVPQALARWLLDWQGLVRPRPGLDALLAVVIGQLRGAAVASILESEVLPARVRGYHPGMLDELCLAGEVVWRGVEASGPADGKVALHLTDRADELAVARPALAGERFDRIRALLARRGAVFFADLVAETGGFANDVAEALWALVWNGEVANDTLAPLRSRLRAAAPAAKRRGGERFRSRRTVLPGTEGRFSLAQPSPALASRTRAAQATAFAEQLLDRYGVVTRDAVMSEGREGGYAALYPVLRAMEEAGRVRRGYFVEGLGATQFALPGIEDRLRSHRAAAVSADLRVLAACDPANPYGTLLDWPKGGRTRPQRVAGARVVLVDGTVRGWLNRGLDHLLTFPPEDEAERDGAAAAVATALATAVDAGAVPPLQLEEIDGTPAQHSPWGAVFERAGFERYREGLVRRRVVVE